MQRAQPNPKQNIHQLDVQHQIQLNSLHMELDVIKNNHLVHISKDIDDLESSLADTKSEINQRFDRLDQRLWWVVGLIMTTLLTIVLSQVFGA